LTATGKGTSKLTMKASSTNVEYFLLFLAHAPWQFFFYMFSGSLFTCSFLFSNFRFESFSRAPALALALSPSPSFGHLTRNTCARSLSFAFAHNLEVANIYQSAILAFYTCILLHIHCIVRHIQTFQIQRWIAQKSWVGLVMQHTSTWCVSRRGMSVWVKDKVQPRLWKSSVCYAGRRIDVAD